MRPKQSGKYEWRGSAEDAMAWVGTQAQGLVLRRVFFDMFVGPFAWLQPANPKFPERKGDWWPLVGKHLIKVDRDPVYVDGWYVWHGTSSMMQDCVGTVCTGTPMLLASTHDANKRKTENSERRVHLVRTSRSLAFEQREWSRYVGERLVGVGDDEENMHATRPM